MVAAPEEPVVDEAFEHAPPPEVHAEGECDVTCLELAS